MVYNPPPLSKSPSLLHHGPLGRASKRGDDRGEEKVGGEASRRGRVNDREEENSSRDWRRGEDTEMSGKYFTNN